MTGKQRIEGIATGVLLLGLLSYLLLRAWYVVPMHDEIATFFHYIETGKIFEQGMVFDANNHFLNSYLGRFFYLIGLDHYFFYRLGNVLAFVLYFFGIRALLKPLPDIRIRFLLLLSCTSVPFVLEYFAYSRGYGMGMAFFVWVLYYAQLFAKERKVGQAFKLAFFTFFMLFSNLIFTGTFCLVLLLLLLVYLKERKQYSVREKRVFASAVIALLLSVAPLMAYSFFLKKIGALYYGSLAGLWEVTGKSLSNVVFFADYQWLKTLFAILLLAGLIFYVLRLFRQSLWDFLDETENLLASFFYGNLAIILVLAWVLKVNYPEDRAGMYLIPLSILLIGFRSQRIKWTKPFSYGMLFFPLTLVFSLSLSTSVFSPDVRMNEWFYKEVRKRITADKNVVVYPTMHLSWHWFEREQQSKIFPNVSSEFDPEFDVIITRMDKLPKNFDWQELKLITNDRETGHIAFEHHKPCEKMKSLEMHPGDSYMQAPVSGSLKLLDIPVQEDWHMRNIEIVISGVLERRTKAGNLAFQLKTYGEKREQLRYDLLEQSWYLGNAKDPQKIQIRQLFKKIKPNEKKLTVYLLNGSKDPVNFSNRKVEIYIVEPNYGTR